MCNIDRIKNLAKEKGIKIKYICAQLGLAETYLSNVKNGKDRMTNDRLSRIAVMLDTTVDYLADVTDDPTPKKKEPVEALDPIDVEILQALRDLSVEDLRKVLEYANSLRGE